MHLLQFFPQNLAILFRLHLNGFAEGGYRGIGLVVLGIKEAEVEVIVGLADLLVLTKFLAHERKVGPRRRISLLPSNSYAGIGCGRLAQRQSIGLTLRPEVGLASA